MKPRSAKNKGASLQVLVVKLLRKLTGMDNGVASNHDGDIQSRSMGSQGTDIVLSPHAKKVIPFDIECKNAEAWHIDKWWDQTQANTEDGRFGLLIIKKNRKKPLAIMDLDEFLKLTIK